MVEESKLIKEKILGYNLFDRLKTRLDFIVVGGVAETTIYKAFREGGRTPTLRVILSAAEELIQKHEGNIEEYLQEQEKMPAA